MQTVRLILDHSNFYCPVTGKLITSEESFAPSPATVFTFVDEAYEFENITPELRTIWDQLDEEIDNDDDLDYEPFDKFCEQIEDDSIVCFRITTRGMACGPTSTTIYIAIDMNYCENQEEDD